MKSVKFTYKFKAYEVSRAADSEADSRGSEVIAKQLLSGPMPRTRFAFQLSN